MTKTVLLSDKVSFPAGIMTQGVETPAGTMVFISGQVARALDGSIVGVGDIHAQTRKVLQNMEAVLAESSATFDDVVQVTVYVTNLEEHLAAIHEVRGEFFKSDYPASTLIEVKRLIHKDMLIEIEAIAVTH